ncbi:MAG: hypothetical protein HQ463_05370 [Bacteroidetes bacterium]|nr:hypothetical protein [Bacteroidota bacterium]
MFKLKQTLQKLFLLIVIIQLANCKNKDCHEDGTCAAEFYRIRINEEVRSYIWSKPGSYWIYKNTATNELDTQVCTAFAFDSVVKRGTENHTKHITIEYDRIRRYIQSSYNQWVYYDRTSENTPNGSSFNNGRTILIREVGGEGSIYPFFYQFNIGDIDGNGSSYTTYKGMDATLTIQGKNYTNVARFDIDSDDIWYPDDHPIQTRYPNALYYWAKDVGLVKRENKSENYSWELIEQNIIK